MLRFFKVAFYYAVLLNLVLSGCRKAEFDKYYGRPDWLAKPIYQQLDSMGNFKNFLACIEKAGYKNTLGSAGSWTVFAPTDEAFQKFMSENNISGIDAIDKELAEKIVRYSMVYDGELIKKLGANFTAKGWVEDIAFRRRTAYYDFVEDETNGISRKIISTNRGVGVAAVPTETNNKHLTYFFKKYMDLKQLSGADYTAFFPGSVYTGLNIQGARIAEDKHDIVAENGIIHVIDKVLMPEKSIDQYIREKSEYSIFKGILNKFATYGLNSDVSHRYEVLTGNKVDVYTKSYTSIALALNNENFSKEDVNDAQINNNSITVPTNDAVNDYAKKVLLKYYDPGSTLEDVFNDNPDILKEYVNSHLYNTQLWKSKFNSQNNILGESPKINTGNIVETKLLSNGAFYGVNESQKANAFHTVYGNLLLDKKYSLMKKALELDGLQLTLKVPTLRYMLLLVSDKVLDKMGFSYDSYSLTTPIKYNGNDGRVMLRRILQQHIIPLGNDPIPDLSGEGILETFNGEYVKYKNNRFYSRGTLDSLDVNKQSIKVDSTNVGIANVSGPMNGIAVYTKGLLSYSDRTIGTVLKELGAESSSSPYYEFFNYLKNTSAGLYDVATGKVSGVDLGVFYTFLIPNNAAMAAAKANGALPASATVTAPDQVEMIKKFIKYHIIKNAFAIDGKKTGTFQSLYKDLDDVTHTITLVSNTSLKVTIRDGKTRDINTILGDSNKLGDRIIIHSIDNYLDYR